MNYAPIPENSAAEIATAHITVPLHVKKLTGLTTNQNAPTFGAGIITLKYITQKF
jgi:hypothetical protein